EALLRVEPLHLPLRHTGAPPALLRVRPPVVRVRDPTAVDDRNVARIQIQNRAALTTAVPPRAITLAEFVPAGRCATSHASRRRKKESYAATARSAILARSPRRGASNQPSNKSTPGTLDRPVR